MQPAGAASLHKPKTLSLSSFISLPALSFTSTHWPSAHMCVSINEDHRAEQRPEANHLQLQTKPRTHTVR